MTLSLAFKAVVCAIKGDGTLVRIEEELKATYSGRREEGQTFK